MTDKSLKKKAQPPEKWQSHRPPGRKVRWINPNRFTTIVAACFMISCFAIYYLGHATMISAMRLSKIIAFLCVIGLLIPWKLYYRWFGWTRVEIFVVNLFGFGPLVSALLLSSNYFIRKKTFEQSYVIEDASVEQYRGMFATPKVLIKLENNALAENKEFRLFDPDEVKQKPHAITYIFADGILGYRVVLDYEFEQ